MVQFYNGYYIYKNKHGIFLGHDDESNVKRIGKLEACCFIMKNYAELVEHHRNIK